MAIYTVGDSISEGCGTVAGVTRAYATTGMGVPAMGTHFAEALAVVQRGDTVIVSAGYNSDIPQEQLTAWIQGLRDKGAKVAILGLRETWAEGGTYAHIADVTPGRNTALRAVAAATGATFVEESITLANQLPGGEIHCRDYQPFVQAATRAVAAQPLIAASATTPTPEATQTQQDAAAELQAEPQKNWFEKAFEAIVNFIRQLFSGLAETGPAEAAPETPATPQTPVPTAGTPPEIAAPGATPAVPAPANVPSR